jgi:anti-sigma B factor antagonist
MGELAGGAASFELLDDGDGAALVRLSGELDMTSVPELEAALEPTISARPARLVLEVGGLRFADSSAIALWVKWAHVVPLIEIREPSTLLRRVITRMGLAERLRMSPVL